MKKAICFLLVLSLVFGMSACAGGGKGGFVQTDAGLTLTRNGLTVTVNPDTGLVIGLASSTDSLEMDGIFVDAGINEASVFSQLGYKDMSGLATYELPTLYPRMKEKTAYSVGKITVTEDGFQIPLTCGDYTFLYKYTFYSNALGLQVELSTSADAKAAVNGVGFLVQGIHGFRLSDASFSFPGSTPAGNISFLPANHYKATTADYSAPAVVLQDGSKTSSFLFVDEVEKWTTGSWYKETGDLCVGFLAAVEGYLDASAPMTVGTLYIPLQASGRTVYQNISDFWTVLGYHTPTDTTATEGLAAIYSGHPYGTMDTGYFNRLTLAEYAQTIDSVADMGFDAMWLLPVFAHSGDNVYEPTDQGIIDKRYGGEQEAAVFIDRAHTLGMKVLFDFVPHGPRPVYSFAKEHEDWVSKKKDGSLQIEWECVSMDYNNPDYAAYNQTLAAHYAKDLGLDGARIDCSMGGLPNWDNAQGLRASAAGLQAGVTVVSSLRQGFKDGGADVLLLPENFHPSPAYASVTDVFYDMPLYRCLYDLNQRGLSGREYAAAVTEFLNAEHQSSVSGQLKLRFLGNHDTVTWTFDAQRAQTLYGTEKAKALWMMLGWIDGVLYIYQGDEDPAAYHLEGENLEAFFTDLIAAKREYLPNTLDTAYLQTGSAVFACRRFDEQTSRLVLVNLSDTETTYTLTASASVLTALGNVTLAGNTVTLSPYSGAILQEG